MTMRCCQAMSFDCYLHHTQEDCELPPPNFYCTWLNNVSQGCTLSAEAMSALCLFYGEMCDKVDEACRLNKNETRCNDLPSCNWSVDGICRQDQQVTNSPTRFIDIVVPSSPTLRPSTAYPTKRPTTRPTTRPTKWPTYKPSSRPTLRPTALPSTPRPTALRNPDCCPLASLVCGKPNTIGWGQRQEAAKEACNARTRAILCEQYFEQCV